MAVRLVLAALLLAVSAPAQEAGPPGVPESGLVPLSAVEPGEMVIRPRKGDARKAFETFLAAHQAHRKDDLDSALRGYVAYLGMPGHYALPARYTRMVRRRVDAMLAVIRQAYAKATALYAQRRTDGLAALERLAKRYPMLPEGRAARALIASDATRDAARTARRLAANGKPKQAAELLERAIRTNPDSLFRYEARRLLVALGGPDLSEPSKQEDGGPARGSSGSGSGEEGDESIIEIAEPPRNPKEPPSKPKPKPKPTSGKERPESK